MLNLCVETPAQIMLYCVCVEEIDVRISSISAVGMSEHSVPGDDIER